jgi:hypothetical protein
MAILSMPDPSSHEGSYTGHAEEEIGKRQRLQKGDRPV